MSALPRLHVHGAAGDDIQLRFAEVLNPDGTLYVENLRTAKATDHFILAGNKRTPGAFEDFEPLFTFHGFRYAEITGVKTRPTLATLKAVVLHTDAPFTTRFATGDTMRNDPSMNSYNHYAYGVVAEWLYRYAAGVDTDPTDPGFHTIPLHPNFDPRLGHLSFAYDSAFGTVHFDWAITGKAIRWKVTVPPNTSASLSTHSSNAIDFTLNGTSLAEGKSQLKPGLSAGDYLVPAGTYSFTATLQQPSASTEVVNATH